MKKLYILLLLLFCIVHLYAQKSSYIITSTETGLVRGFANGGSYSNVDIDSTGCLKFGSGNTSHDVYLYRSGDSTLKISNDGGSGKANVSINGNIGICTDTPRYKLEVIDSSVAGGSTIKNAGNFELTFSSGNQSAEANAIVGELSLTGSTIASGSLADAPAGVSGFMIHGSTGTVEEAYGIAGGFMTLGANPVGTTTLGVGILGLILHDTTGTITQGSALRGVLQNTSSGTITNAIGLDIFSIINSGGGIITNAYGIKLGDIDAGTNNWSIKTGTGLVSFGDQIGIGISIPATSAALDITSTTGALIVSRMTTTQRDALTAINGMIIYNTTTNAFNFYENSVWVTK